MSAAPFLHLELELIDPAQDKRRHYAMSVLEDPQLPLFASTLSVLLVVSRGRIGHRAVIDRRRYTDLEPLAQKWRELLARRRQHGYVEVKVSRPPFDR